VTLFFGKGDGTFVTIKDVTATRGNVRAITVADSNHDGFKDIVTANTDVNTISVLLGKGDGTFLTAVSYSVGKKPFDIVIVDINQDGHDDVATADYDSNTVSILLGQGDGTLRTLESVSVGAGTGPVKLTVLDLNSDGNKDIVTLGYNSNTINILLNQGNVTFSPPHHYHTPQQVGYGLLVVDVTSDERPDVLVTIYDDLVVTGRGDNNFRFNFHDYASYAIPKEDPGAVMTTDLNGDGKPDIVVVHQDSDSVSILLAQHEGIFFQLSITMRGHNPKALMPLI
jgi:hypothetical protein